MARESGMTYGRLRDMLSCRHGAPTCGELAAVCRALGVDAARVLREALGGDAGAARAVDVRRVDDGTLLAEIARRLQSTGARRRDAEDARAMIAELESGSWTVAASRDPGKRLESEGGDGR